MDKRLNALETWIKSDKSIELKKIEPASADASFRRYFRVHLKPCEKFNNSDTLIAMDAPPEHENNTLFIKCSQILNSCGLHSPIVFQTELDQGFLLIEDLGTLTYHEQLKTGDADKLYSDAAQALLKLQLITPESAFDFKRYDTPTLLEEMALFEHWYINIHLEGTLNQQQKTSLNNTFKVLIENAKEQPQVLVHRDYHCRNLLVTKSNNPGIIDFQDMIIGPISYDLVSLFKDCYISWPRHKVINWVEESRLSSIQAQIIKPSVTAEQWLRWFDLMGVQRHLKVLGIFARLNYRDNKPHYLEDLPLVNQYLKDTCADYKELNPLGNLLKHIHKTYD